MKKFLFTLLLPLMLPAGEVIFKNDFNRALTNWSIPPYYNGKMEVAPAGRQGSCMKLTAAPGKKKGVWARTYRSVRLKEMKSLKGKVLRISGYVRGKGEFVPGFAMTVKAPGKKERFRYDGSEAVKLTPEWKFFEHFSDCGTEDITTLQTRLDLPGAGEAFIDDLCVELVKQDGCRISVMPSGVKVRSSDKMPQIEFSTGRSGEVLTVVLTDAANKQILKEKLLTNKNGKAAFIPAKALPAGVNRVTASFKGIKAAAVIEVVK